jgi:oligoendopeptidase F
VSNLAVTIRFAVDRDDVETACAILIADGKRPTKKAVLTWARDRYWAHGGSDVNEDLLHNAGIDLENDEDLWARTLIAADRIYPRGTG